mgnify:CR=1 FL=1
MDRTVSRDVTKDVQDVATLTVPVIGDVIRAGRETTVKTYCIFKCSLWIFLNTSCLIPSSWDFVTFERHVFFIWKALSSPLKQVSKRIQNANLVGFQIWPWFSQNAKTRSMAWTAARCAETVVICVSATTLTGTAWMVAVLVFKEKSVPWVLLCFHFNHNIFVQNGI